MMGTPFQNRTIDQPMSEGKPVISAEPALQGPVRAASWKAE
jgi:hypothetical protein